MKPLAWAAAGTLFTFFMTCLGSSMVFFFRKTLKASVQRVLQQEL